MGRESSGRQIILDGLEIGLAIEFSGGTTPLLPPFGGPVLVPFARRGAVAQGAFQALGVREPIVGVLGQAAEHDALEILGDAARTEDGGMTGSRAWVIMTPTLPPRSNGGRPVSRGTGDEPAQRVDVAPFVELPVAHRLLRRHEHRVSPRSGHLRSIEARGPSTR